MGQRVRRSASFLSFFFFVLSCPSSLFGQTTQVTGQVTDVNGLPYAGASMKAGLVFAGTPVSNPTVTINTLSQCKANGFGSAPCQVPFAPTNGPFNLDSQGNIPGGGITLQDNTQVTPSGTQWAFTVNTPGSPPPLGTGPQVCSATLTISGASQVVSSSFSCPALSRGGGGGVGGGAAPVLGFYLGSNCPVANTGQCFNSPSNTQQVNFCSYTSGQPTVTCDSYAQRVSASITSNVVTYTFSPLFPAPLNWAASNSITVSGFTAGDAIFNITCTLSTVTATNVTCPLVHANASSTTFGFILNTSVGPFVAADVGKRIFGYNTCDDAFNLVPSANLPITSSTALTISAVTNSTTVQMSGNAANTVTIAAGPPRTGCVIWGNPDDSGAALADAAMQASASCPILHSFAGGYLFTTPHFTKNPLSCIASGANGGVFGPGNIVYSAGFHWEGRGSGATINYLTPGFPESGSCTNGFSALACWVVPLEGELREMQFSGGGNAVASAIPTGTNLFELDGPASLANMVFSNFGERGSAAGTLFCIAAYYLTQINHVNSTGCGTESLATNSISSVTAIQFWAENIGVGGIDVGRLSEYAGGQSTLVYSKYHFICYDCTVGVEGMVDAGTPPFLLVNRNGLRIKWYRGALSTESFPAQTQNNMVGYFNAVAGGVLDVEDASFNLSAPSSGTGYIALQCAAACTNFVKNTAFGATTGGNTYKDVAGSIFWDLGGNTGLTSAPGISLSGAFIGEANSSNPTIVTAAKTVLSANWGTGAAVSALSGGDFPIQFTVTNGSAATGASPTITYTFPTPLPIAPFSCTATQTGGTNPTGTFTSSAVSATGVTFTFSLTPTANDTEIVQVTCTTP